MILERCPSPSMSTTGQLMAKSTIRQLKHKHFFRQPSPELMLSCVRFEKCFFGWKLVNWKFTYFHFSSIWCLFLCKSYTWHLIATKRFKQWITSVSNIFDNLQSAAGREWGLWRILKLEWETLLFISIRWIPWILLFIPPETNLTTHHSTTMGVIQTKTGYLECVDVEQELCCDHVDALLRLWFPVLLTLILPHALIRCLVCCLASPRCRRSLVPRSVYIQSIFWINT